MSPQLTYGLDKVADAINPALCLLLILGPLLLSRKTKESLPWTFWARSVLAILLVYLIAQFDRRAHLWPSLGLDYSTHSALALAISTSLAFCQRRWLYWLVPLLVFYAVVMLILGYHSVADMLTTALVIVPLAAACHLIFRQLRPVAVTE